MRSLHLAIGFLALVGYFGAGCGGDNSGSSGPPTGQACTTAAQCYPGVTQSQIQGTVTCLTAVSGGYCTHTCQTDADCCKVAGECAAKITEVCSPFESQGATYCFVSCSDAALSAAGYTDSTAFCQHYAGPTFSCRSTGGGTNNQKFCG